MMNRKSHNIGTVGVDLLKAYTPMTTSQPEPKKESIKSFQKHAPMNAFVSEVKRKKKFTCD